MIARATSGASPTGNSRIERHHKRLRKQMIPAEVLRSPEKQAAEKARKIDHEAVGKSIRLVTAASPYYPGLGAQSLVDGKVSGPNHDSGLWLGFHGDNLEVVIDLGTSRPIQRMGVRFLQSNTAGIYLPKKLVFEVSGDGKTFSPAASIDVKPVSHTQDNQVHTVFAGKRIDASRYVRIRATNIARIPAGRRAAGRKAGLFADEILINPIPGESGNEDNR